MRGKGIQGHFEPLAGTGCGIPEPSWAQPLVDRQPIAQTSASEARDIEGHLLKDPHL